MVGEPGDRPQGAPFSLASDDDRGAGCLRALRLVAGVRDREVLAIEGGLFVLEHADDDLDRLVEPVEALGQRVAQRDAVGVGLELVPTCTQPELEAAVGDDVEGRRHVGGDRGMAIWHAVHHRSDPEPVGGVCQRRQRGPALEAGAVRVPEDRVEMIEHPGGVDVLALIGTDPGSQHGLPGRVMGIGLDPVVHGGPSKG